MARQNRYVFVGRRIIAFLPAGDRASRGQQPCTRLNHSVFSRVIQVRPRGRVAMMAIHADELRAGDVIEYHGEQHRVTRVDRRAGWAWPIAADESGWAIACVNHHLIEVQRDAVEDDPSSGKNDSFPAGRQATNGRLAATAGRRRGIAPNVSARKTTFRCPIGLDVSGGVDARPDRRPVRRPAFGADENRSSIEGSAPPEPGRPSSVGSARGGSSARPQESASSLLPGIGARSSFQRRLATYHPVRRSGASAARLRCHRGEESSAMLSSRVNESPPSEPFRGDDEWCGRSGPGGGGVPLVASPLVALAARCTRVTPSWPATPRPRRSPRPWAGATPSMMCPRG